MVQAGRRASFKGAGVPELAVTYGVVVDQLDGDWTVQNLVNGAVDATHPAAPELLNEPEPAGDEALARRRNGLTGV
jgi:hypothetical protein